MDDNKQEAITVRSASWVRGPLNQVAPGLLTRTIAPARNQAAGPSAIALAYLADGHPQGPHRHARLGYRLRRWFFCFGNG